MNTCGNVFSDTIQEVAGFYYARFFERCNCLWILRPTEVEVRPHFASCLVAEAVIVGVENDSLSCINNQCPLHNN